MAISFVGILLAATVLGGIAAIVAVVIFAGTRRGDDERGE